jgi:hypothetical protein
LHQQQQPQISQRTCQVLNNCNGSFEVREDDKLSQIMGLHKEPNKNQSERCTS